MATITYWNEARTNGTIRDTKEFVPHRLHGHHFVYNGASRSRPWFIEIEGEVHPEMAEWAVMMLHPHADPETNIRINHGASD